MATTVMQAIIITFIVLFCFCALTLMFTENRQGSRFLQAIREKRNKLQQDTFCCMHCGVRKSANQLSAEINRMCRECAQLYERVQDEP